MDPRLVGIVGPLKGAVFAIVQEEFTIGREESNKLHIVDRAVSRRHSVIKKEASHFKINDLDSRNGTFVNGVPVKERLLEHGDHIRIGCSVFFFLLHEGEVPPTPIRVQLIEGRLTTQTMIQLPMEDSLPSQSKNALAALPATERTVRDLSGLLRISSALSSVRGLEALQQKLLETIFEVVPADRGAVILVGESPEEFASIFGWDRFPGQDRPVQVSRAAIDRALRERASMLSNDVVQTEVASAGEAPIATPISSLLVVPLVVSERTVGAVYLDTINPMVHFDANHLEWVAGVGGIAAAALDNARRTERLESENRRLQDEINIEHNMVGESPRMQEVFQFIARVAPTDSTVLICGESGTGKELVARAIHQNSGRAGKPFVAINCAALTETLLESEMFGHEKGAFTGAIAQKKGRLEVADGGTVFLDEVAEMAPSLQAKLLRVLQEREFERVGGTRPIKVDIRLIAATNKDLEEAARSTNFRQDLYYRLNVVALTVPPLRERRKDIPLLASYFAAKYAEKAKRRVIGVAPEARTCLVNYDWPGNVRELENAIERAVVLGSSEIILPENLPEALLEVESPKGGPIAKYHEAVREAKKQLILKALEVAGGNYTQAAKALGVHPNYLHRLIRNMNLKPAQKN